MMRDLNHCNLIPRARRTNRLLDCGTRADKSTTAWPRDERFQRISVRDLPSDTMLAVWAANSGELAEANVLATTAICAFAGVFLIIGASVAT
jgi:hypothetical protein